MASIVGIGSLFFSNVSTTESNWSNLAVRSSIKILTRYSLLIELVHLDTRGEDLDAEPVHHQHLPLHLARLLVVPQHITQQSWQISRDLE